MKKKFLSPVAVAAAVAVASQGATQEHIEPPLSQIVIINPQFVDPLCELDPMSSGCLYSECLKWFSLRICNAIDTVDGPIVNRVLEPEPSKVSNYRFIAPEPFQVSKDFVLPPNDYHDLQTHIHDWIPIRD